jgi:hypothetical protein
LRLLKKANAGHATAEELDKLKASPQIQALLRKKTSEARQPLLDGMVKLQDPIQNAQRDCVPEVERAPLQKQLACEVLKAEARTALRQATSSRHPGIEELEAVIQAGKRAELEAAELAEAEGLLVLERRRREARAALSSAVETASIDSLEAAIGLGKAAKLLPRELDAAQAKLEYKRRDARAALASALETASIESLEVALSQGKEAELLPFELDEAQTKLDNEYKRRDARAALASAVRAANVDSLEAAIGPLEAAIEAGKQANLETSELAEAESLLALEIRRRDARAALASAVNNPSIKALTAAIGLSKKAKLLAIEFATATASLDLEYKRRDARRGLASAMENPRVDDLEVAISYATSLHLPSTDLAAAEELLAQLKAEAAMMKALAASPRRSCQVREALEMCRAAKLPSTQLSRWGKDLVDLERQEASARQRILKLLEDPDPQIEELESALAQGQSVGLADEEIEPLRMRLKKIEQQKAEYLQELEECERQSQNLRKRKKVTRRQPQTVGHCSPQGKEKKETGMFGR